MNGDNAHVQLSSNKTARLRRSFAVQGFIWPNENKMSDARSAVRDRKSTRLNSSHSQISYAVFCLKKKKITRDADIRPSATQPNRSAGMLRHSYSHHPTYHDLAFSRASGVHY